MHMDAVICTGYRIPSNLDIIREVVEIDASRLADCRSWHTSQVTSDGIDHISSDGCTGACVIGNDTTAVIRYHARAVDMIVLDGGVAVEVHAIISRAEYLVA